MKRSRFLLVATACLATLVTAPLLAQAGGDRPVTAWGSSIACDEISAASKARKPGKKKQAGPAAAQQPKKPSPVERTPYTAEDREAAVIPGLPNVRFFADSFGAFSDALPRQRGPWLILSSGGSTGAYGAGVLVGLSQSGKRPDYSVVTGVSIGAVMAPYAFLGQKYDDKLRDSFLTLTSADVFEDAVRLHPTDVNAIMALADCYVANNRLDRAITVTRVAAQLAIEAQDRAAIQVIDQRLQRYQAIAASQPSTRPSAGSTAK